MFPWNYGFHWTAGNLIFLGAFYSVAALVAATVVLAVLRARRAAAEDAAGRIRWMGVFHDLPPQSRTCRHALTGELPGRTCPNGFECRRCSTHAEQMKSQAAEIWQTQEEVFGMTFQTDRLYHRGHTWVRPEADGTVTVGLDELGRRLIGVPDGVELPRAGTRWQANGTGWLIRKRGAAVHVLAPVDGVVIESRAAEDGGCVCVRPTSGTFDLRHLLTRDELAPWILREMDRLQLALSATGVPALADGGLPVDDISANYPEADWDAVCGEMFLQG